MATALTVEPDDPRQAARAAGLRYVSDEQPGIRRRRSGAGFVYLDPKGNRVADAETLSRIRAVVVPPAWTEVWICPFATGHVQATGRDARGRKQYRYHARWREVRDDTKYDRMLPFARALPRLRRRVSEDLTLAGLPREKVLAAVVRILDRGFLRVGNEDYARENGSYGVTTLRSRHVEVAGDEVRMRFRGKHGHTFRIGLRDRKLARVVRRLDQLPGQGLFQYLDEADEVRQVASDDVNDYIRAATGDDFTAKDFRTWAGSVLAMAELGRMEPPSSEAEGRRLVSAAVRAVATELGNTPAVCRKCYMHPAVIDAYRDGELEALPKHTPEQVLEEDLEGGLRDEEKALLRFLQRR